MLGGVAIGVKLDFLRTDPVTSVIDAAQRGLIVKMSVQHMDPTVRTISGLEILADSLERVAEGLR